VVVAGVHVPRARAPCPVLIHAAALRDERERKSCRELLWPALIHAAGRKKMRVPACNRIYRYREREICAYLSVTVSTDTERERDAYVCSPYP
jgi:hypothetical protein